MSDKVISDLLKQEHKKDNREIIIEHLTSEVGAVILTSEQQDLLDKWQFADDQCRANKYTTSEIIRLIMKKYDVAIATAWRYLGDARYVFGSSMKSNKKYLLALHADRIELAMQMAFKNGDLKSYAALSREYTSAVKEMPDDSKGRTQAAMTVFMISSTQIDVLMDSPITEAEAREVAKGKIGEEIEYIES